MAELLGQEHILGIAYEVLKYLVHGKVAIMYTIDVTYHYPTMLLLQYETVTWLKRGCIDEK